MASIEKRERAGSFVDPALARITVGEWAEIWLACQAHLQTSSRERERYAGILREHIVPTWARVQLANVSHADVQTWVTRLATRRSPATVRKVHRVLSLILDLGVKDGRLARNVAETINLPRPVKAEQRYLTIAEVEALANEFGHPAGSASTGRTASGTARPTGSSSSSSPTRRHPRTATRTSCATPRPAWRSPTVPTSSGLSLK